VTDDFIARYGGRIFNTAGDAVLAEFPSAVEAVRCAIDIQESLRTRNLAYPPSRQMSFRIGITIGDVVERDGDLLGDGVNIAARLEGLAEVGGICISRAVHEQVANKLSVQFADIGAQEVKNIPNPVHAFMVSMKREDGTFAPARKPAPQPSSAPNWLWPAVVMVVCLAAIGVGGFLYFTKLEIQENSKGSLAANMPAAPAPAPTPTTKPKMAASPMMSPTPTPPSQPAMVPGERFAAETVPFVGDKVRLRLASDYVPAPGAKALALTISGINAFVANQPNEEAARNAALEQCQRYADNLQPQRKCEVYAVGDTVVYSHGRPPMPMMPWMRYDPITEKPFVPKDTPLLHDPAKSRLEAMYPQSRKAKSVAIGPGGQFFFNLGLDNTEEAMRRNLEMCGAATGVACMIVALDDAFVVPVPAIMKVIGFFQARNSMIAPDARDDVMHRLADASSGWNAVAIGAAGRPGLGLKGANEQAAVSEALSNCAKHDSECHVIAIGPFLVAPN
jgi:Adenylate and Guanylate cyclase catalytic domain